jgi:hypothetical protein
LEEEADIEVKTDITFPAGVSSRNPSCTNSKFSEPTINTERNISQNVDTKQLNHGIEAKEKMNNNSSLFRIWFGIN